MKQSMSCEAQERILTALRVWWKTHKSVHVLMPKQAALYFREMQIHGTN